MTRKSYTYSFEKWTQILNPVLRGKFNYFQIMSRACKEVREVLKSKGYQFHGYPYRNYHKLDGYVRQRLRVNFSNRGKKHGGVRQGKLLTVKYGNEFFIKDMKLVTGRYLNDLVYNSTLTIEEYIEKHKKKNPPVYHNGAKDGFFKYAYAK